VITLSYIITHTGIYFDLLNPKKDKVEINDIAHALSLTCRYNGHIPFHYSVAEHSCHVADKLINWGFPELAFDGLMHDAAEAYTGDIVHPLKSSPEFWAVFAPIEERLEQVVADRFGLIYPMHELVKQADKAVYEWEVEHIRTGKVKGYSPKVAKDQFLTNYYAMKIKI
jgi:hypothetical protein